MSDEILRRLDRIEVKQDQSHKDTQDKIDELRTDLHKQHLGLAQRVTAVETRVGFMSSVFGLIGGAIVAGAQALFKSKGGG